MGDYIGIPDYGCVSGLEFGEMFPPEGWCVGGRKKACVIGGGK